MSTTRNGLRIRLALLWLIALALCPAAHAHEARPASLEVVEIAPARYSLTWRTPVLAGMRLPIVLVLPEAAHNVTEPALRELPDSLLERRLIDVEGGLPGKRIEFAGLQGTITDVLVRVRLLDGTQSATLVHPSQPWVEVTASRGIVAVAGAYLLHGIEHILLGYDHLLFVFALVLIVRRGWVLVETITAFTIAHSITLALATLGVVNVPGPPVEAVIALSILLLTCEVVRLQRGQPSLTAKWPWVVAFTFGLLHGFGFAGALSELGLPQGDVPLALFAFNVGVELGQLIFIAVVLGAIAVLRRLSLPALITRHALRAASYAIGGLAAFWFFERLSGFFT